MGWTDQPTEIFDAVYNVIMDEGSITYDAAVNILAVLVTELIAGDWDNEGGSDHWGEPMFNDAFEKAFPGKYKWSDYGR